MTFHNQRGFGHGGPWGSPKLVVCCLLSECCRILKQERPATEPTKPQVVTSLCEAAWRLGLVEKPQDARWTGVLLETFEVLDICISGDPDGSNEPAYPVWCYDRTLNNHNHVVSLVDQARRLAIVRCVFASWHP